MARAATTDMSAPLLEASYPALPGKATRKHMPAHHHAALKLVVPKQAGAV